MKLWKACIEILAELRSCLCLFCPFENMFKRTSCDHIKAREASAMLSVSKIVAKAMLDLLRQHFYSMHYPA